MSWCVIGVCGTISPTAAVSAAWEVVPTQKRMVPEVHPDIEPSLFRFWQDMPRVHAGFVEADVYRYRDWAVFEYVSNPQTQPHLWMYDSVIDTYRDSCKKNSRRQKIKERP